MKLIILCLALLACQVSCRAATSCGQNQFWNKYLCVDCQSNCKCSAILTCDSCVADYYFKVENTCVSCTGNCKVCADATTCKQCDDNYLLYNGICINEESQSYQFNYWLFTLQSSVSPGICIQTNVTSFQCQNCTSSQFQTLNGDCQNCPSHCDSCSMSNQCLTCSAGYRWNGNFCIACLTNCKTCADGFTCTACNDYYFYDSLTTTCIPCDTGNCITCTSATTCTSCNPASLLIGGQCKLCLYPCEKCDSQNNLCVTCFDRFYLLNGVCSSCSSKDISWALCENDVSTSDLPYPTQCQNSYIFVYPDATNTGKPKCLPNPSFACLTSQVDATLAATVKCQTCKQGQLMPDGTCCSGSISGSTCYYCPTNCANCLLDGSSVAQCQSCNVGYTLESNTCKSCVAQYTAQFTGCLACTPTTCTKCQDFYRQASTAEFTLFSQYCLGCPSNCKSCDATSCTECSKDYYLSNGNCYTKVAFCKTMNSTSCGECLPGFRLDQGICRKCINSLGQWVCDFNAGFNQTKIDQCTNVWGKALLFSSFLMITILN